MKESEATPSHEPSLWVVLDTNVWRSEPMLRTPLGAALLHSLTQASGKLGLPEVVHTEAVYQLTALGETAVSRIENDLYTLKLLMGKAPSPSLPSKAEITAHVDSWLDALDHLTERFPLTLDQVRRALHQVITKVPPNKTKEQFRDTLIWQSVLDQATRRQVLFVTQDKQFFDANTPEKGLAPELTRMAQDGQADVKVFDTLTACLEHLATEVPPLDLARVAAAVDEALLPLLSKRAGDRGFAIGPLKDRRVKAFATEHPSRLVIDFRLSHEMTPVVAEPGESLPVGYITVEGSCFYMPEADRAKEPRPDAIEYQWHTEDGPQTARDVFVRVGGAIGERFDELVLRHPVPVEDPPEGNAD